MLELELDHSLPGFRLQLGFTVDAEILVLLGRSGAGKTLTLRAVAGLFRPTVGRIVLKGRVLFDSRAGINLPPQVRRVGYVPQSYALFPHLTVSENVAYGIRRQAGAEMQKRVGELLALTGLEQLADRRPRELSGGQQQRVALARALAVRPDALLLDEPLSALDAPTRSELRRLLRDLQRHFEVPTLFVTHDLSEALCLADRIAVLEAGRLLQIGRPAELLARPTHVRVAQLTGVCNILPGRVQAMKRDSVLVQVGARTLLARVDVARVHFAVGQAVYVCLRSERITLVIPERTEHPHANQAEGEVIGAFSDDRAAILLFRLNGPRLAPERAYDLEIELPMDMYEQLGLATNRAWTISISSDALHLLPAERDDDLSVRGLPSPRSRIEDPGRVG